MNRSNLKFRLNRFLKIHSMSEWLDIMLEEIDRKKREAEQARNESERRASGDGQSQQAEPAKDPD